MTGSVDPGEDFTQAAKREAIEETGLQQDNIKRMLETDMVFEFKDRWGDQVREKVFIIECKSHFEVVIDPDEHQDHKWVPKEELGADNVKFESNWLALRAAMELV